MMELPSGLIEGLTDNLPPVNEYDGDFIRQDFIYNNQEFSLYFYKVKDVGDYFWLCNPNQIYDRIK